MPKTIPYAGLKPGKVTNTAWCAVVEAWENGLSDREAAFRASKAGRAHIKESDIKEWIRDNPDIAMLRDSLHSDILTAAKLTIADRIKEGDVRTAKWYLERKAAEEFSTRAAVAFEGAAIELSLEDKERMAKDFMRNFGAEPEEKSEDQAENGEQRT